VQLVFLSLWITFLLLTIGAWTGFEACHAFDEPA
jgi:succinate-acetate transporter protein